MMVHAAERLSTDGISHTASWSRTTGVAGPHCRSSIAEIGGYSMGIYRFDRRPISSHRGDVIGSRHRTASVSAVRWRSRWEQRRLPRRHPNPSRAAPGDGSSVFSARDRWSLGRSGVSGMANPSVGIGVDRMTRLLARRGGRPPTVRWQPKRPIHGLPRFDSHRLRSAWLWEEAPP